MISLKPHLTEKSLSLPGRYTFITDRQTTKSQVRDALKRLYNVDAIRILTANKAPLTQRSSRTLHLKTRRAFKKVTVILKEKQTINLFPTKK